IMKHSKKILNKLMVVSLGALFIIGNCGALTNVFGVRPQKKVKGQTVTVSSQKNYKDRVNGVQKILEMNDTSFNGISIILDCGMYGNVFHSQGYESHHLVSNKFCQMHSDIICTDEAPSVLIPHDIHAKTGSYGKSPDSEYFQKEKECFKKGGIKAVLKYGLNDLKNAFKESNVECGNLLNGNNLILNKLYSYADLFDARTKARKTGNVQDANKVQFILKYCISTPAKPKMRKGICKNDVDNNKKNSEKHKRTNREEVFKTPVKKTRTVENSVKNS
ncbi:MAG: hypothetical protein IJJ04_03915, partial [Clostridia bacterium]|nr:hypothetical protein [Clostridia bacterium]